MRKTFSHLHYKFLLLILTCSSIQAGAQITVSQNTDSIILTANSDLFNTAPPPVVIHDDFDNGVAGQPLQNWTISSSSNKQNPSYSNEAAITGTLSGMSSFLGGNYNSSAENKNLPNMDVVYLSYYFKVDLIAGAPSRNIKLARLSGGHDGSTYVQSVSFTFYDTQATGNFQQASIDFAESKVKPVWTADYVDNRWHRAEMYIKLSNPAGAANGITIAKIDGNIISNQTNIVNEETGMRYKWLTLPYYVAHDAGGDYKIYYDNVVVSKSRARVEICENDNYKECKNPVIAQITAWQPKSISIKKENYTAKKPYYFIFNDSDVLVNNKGVYYCPECPSKPIPN